MSPDRAKILTYFLLSTPLDGKGVPPFAIAVFYILSKRIFLVHKKALAIIANALMLLNNI
jgi:hypothetical protein